MARRFLKYEREYLEEAELRKKAERRIEALAKWVRDGGSIHGEDHPDVHELPELAAVWYARPADDMADRIERVTLESLADAIIACTAAGKETSR